MPDGPLNCRRSLHSGVGRGSTPLHPQLWMHRAETLLRQSGYKTFSPTLMACQAWNKSHVIPNLTTSQQPKLCVGSRKRFLRNSSPPTAVPTLEQFTGDDARQPSDSGNLQGPARCQRPLSEKLGLESAILGKQPNLHVGTRPQHQSLKAKLPLCLQRQRRDGMKRQRNTGHLCWHLPTCSGGTKALWSFPALASFQLPLKSSTTAFGQEHVATPGLSAMT